MSFWSVIFGVSACVGSASDSESDSAGVHNDGYRDVIETSMFRGEEWRVLIELYQAQSPKLIYEINSPAESVQLNVLDGSGNLLWIQDVAGPERVSFSPSTSCTPNCTFISKVVYLSGESDIEMLLGVEASDLEGIVLTAQQ